MKIEEEFAVKAPAEKVWAYLTDPERVVKALPGAELAEKVDESTFAGGMSVKVGPVSVSYKGTVRFEELDEQNHIAVIVASGRGARGMGSAEMRMTSKLTELSPSETQVTVTSELNVSGILAQFGRGMIQQVSQRMFQEFTERLRRELEEEKGAQRDSA